MNISVNFNGNHVSLETLKSGDNAYIGGYFNGGWLTDDQVKALEATGKYRVTFVKDRILDMNGYNDNSHYRIFVK